MDTEEAPTLVEWMNRHWPDETLLWKVDALHQMCFVRDRLPILFGLLWGNNHEDPRDRIRVVGQHRSKSIELPVYGIKVPTVEVRMRNNFFNWVVSVKVVGIVGDNFGHLLSKGEREGSTALIYAEGFTEDWIFVPFRSRRTGPNTKFTATLFGSNYKLFTFLYLLTEQLGLHKVWEHDR